MVLVLPYHTFQPMLCPSSCVDTLHRCGSFRLLHHSPVIHLVLLWQTRDCFLVTMWLQEKSPGNAFDLLLPLGVGTLSLPGDLKDILKGDASYLFQTHMPPPRHKGTSQYHKVKWFLSFFYFFFWLHCMSCGIFVPWLGTKPGPLVVKTQES